MQNFTLQVASNMATGKIEKGKKRDLVNDAEDDAKQEQGQHAVTRGRSKEKCRKNKKRRPRTPKENEARRSSRPKENEARRSSRPAGPTAEENEARGTPEKNLARKTTRPSQATTKTTTAAAAADDDDVDADDDDDDDGEDGAVTDLETAAVAGEAVKPPRGGKNKKKMVDADVEERTGEPDGEEMQVMPGKAKLGRNDVLRIFQAALGVDDISKATSLITPAAIMKVREAGGMVVLYVAAAAVIVDSKKSCKKGRKTKDRIIDPKLISVTLSEL